MIKMAMFNVQRVITEYVGKPELWFMSSAHCLMVKISQMVSELWSGHELMKR